MKNINELKQGEKIYFVESYKVNWMAYLCIHPNNKEYHILINQCQDPVRYYDEHLQRLLDQNLKSYDEARFKLAEILEEKARSYREKI